MHIAGRLLCGLAAVALLLTGCEEGSGSSSISITSSSVVELYPVVGQSAKITFDASASWKATCQADWVTFSPRSGSAGSNTITVTTTSTNRTKANRSSSMTISTSSGQRNVTLVQSGKYALFGQKEYKVPAEGGTLVMDFRSNLEQDETLQIMYSQQDWINWSDNARSETRAEWAGNTGSLHIAANTTPEARAAVFILALAADGGNWMGLDTAYVSQAGIADTYASTDFTADGRVSLLQQSTAGRGIPIVLMGDGFADRDIQDSTYHRTMAKAMEHIFSEEPVKSLRAYFDVYAVTAVSSSGTVGEDSWTAFSTVPSFANTSIDYDDDKVTAYVNKVEGIDTENALAVVIVNSHSYNGVTALFVSDAANRPRQYAVALCCLMDGADSEEFRQVLVHEAVGHGLAKLADEYGYDTNAAPSDAETRRLKAYHQYDWMLNVDDTDDTGKVLWSRFIGDSRFDQEGIGVYEGGYTYTSGIYRPTEESMMRSNRSPFNAPSRKAIYDRIMALGEDRAASTVDAFAAFDEQHKPTRWSYALTRAPWQQRRPVPPVIKHTK